MPYGAGPAIRLALISGKPWQRYLICVAMSAGGAAFVALGHVAGVALAGSGLPDLAIDPVPKAHSGR
jgi:hypothetical protein